MKMTFKMRPLISEGVQFNHLGDAGVDQALSESGVEVNCVECGKATSLHGWLGDLVTGQKVCPGSWVMTGCGSQKPSVFTAEELQEVFESVAVETYRIPPGMSSNIAAVKYNPGTSVMHILFSSGGFYRYTGVRDSTWRALVAAPSIGKAFSEAKKTSLVPNFEKLDPSLAWKEF